jgi:hypothetical protein
MDRIGYPASVRLLVFALTYQTKLEATEGDREGAVADVLAGCRFALDVKRRLLLIDQMVGGAASNYALDTGFQVVGRCALGPPLLRRLQDRLVELSRDPMWYVDLKGEELAALDAVQEICARARGARDKKDMGSVNKILGQLWIIPEEDEGIEVAAERAYSSVQGHTPEELAGLVRKGYAYLDSISSKTPFQLKKEAIDADQTWKELVGGNKLLCGAPAVSRPFELSFRMVAQRDALITTLALLRYKDDKGGFPADLQELVSAGYVAQMPMDPYSDKPLVYRRTENNFLLYSVGADFRDGGGQHDRRWGQGEQGGDYVFWPVRVR